MNFKHITHSIALGCLLTFTAGRASADGIIPGIEATMLQVNQELDEAARKLTSENLTFSAADDNDPEAAITPQDELLIGDTPQTLDPAQRAHVHDYRQQTIAVAMEGIEIGRRGAQIGIDAAGPMIIKALFGADDDSIEREMEARLAPIHQAVAKLCERLPALMATEQRLAAAVPAFQPYANLSQDDIDDCRKDSLDLAGGTANGASM